jgi:Tol biopolymer transport system component
LFKNGVPLGKTLASPTDLREEFQLDHPVYWMSLSPDGNTVAYVDDNNYSIWLKNLITGETTMLLQQEGDTLHWSPDGSKLVYTFWDTDSWDYRVGIYDRATGTKELLTKDMGVYEDYPSWSPDGTKIVFTSSRSGF